MWKVLLMHAMVLAGNWSICNFSLPRNYKRCCFQGSIFCFLFCMEKRSNKPNNVMTTCYVKQLIVASEFGLIKGVLIAFSFCLMVVYLHFQIQLYI